MTPRERKREGTVKTTVLLTESLLIRAKQEAIGRKISLSEMIEQLLRENLNMPDQDAGPE